MTTYAVNRKTKEHRVAKPGESWAHPWQLLSADSEGWVEWYGGESPLPKDAEFEVKRRDGEKVESRFLMSPSWSRDYGDRRSEIIAYRPILDAKPGPVEWDGEGLPPVGCECEMARAGESYAPGCLRYIGDDLLVWQFANGVEIALRPEHANFRSIRTEEDKAVEEIVHDLSGAGCRGLSMKHIARKLYEIGYRKT